MAVIPIIKSPTKGTIHSDGAERSFPVKVQNKNKPEVDAVITNQRNLPIAILTADCAPILIYD
ncbi:laccase domain-containing protein, partial [Pelagibacterales bacterium SAG-MED06]|nr:laccase domain-containing protein [Pelagibacterales bacterium SAG-MED06]